MSSAPRILHIGNEMLWRGGENQVRLLIEGSKNQIMHFVAYPSGSQGLDRFSKIAKTLALPSKSSIDPRNVWALVRFCRENKIQILDAQSSVGLTMALATKKRLPAIKVVAHRRVDNAISTGFFTRRKYLSPQIDAFVAISGAIKKMLLDYGVPSEKVHLVRSAVGDSGVKRSVSDREEVLIGNASALTSQKGHDYLIQACRILADKNLKFKCRIAGDGPDETSLLSLVKELKLDSYVELVGRVQDVPQFLSELDVLCVPSRNEGLGTILLEGVFAGCALVGTAVGGIPEIIHDHETGLLVPAHNVPALARALEEVIMSPDLRTRLVSSAKLHVEAQFSLNAMVQGNIAVYKKII